MSPEKIARSPRESTGAVPGYVAPTTGFEKPPTFPAGILGRFCHRNVMLRRAVVGVRPCWNSIPICGPVL